MPISPQRNGAPSVARPPYPVNATTLVPSRLSATRRSTAFERRLCRRNPVLGGGREERAVRRATTVGRWAKPPPSYRAPALPAQSGSGGWQGGARREARDDRRTGGEGGRAVGGGPPAGGGRSPPPSYRAPALPAQSGSGGWQGGARREARDDRRTGGEAPRRATDVRPARRRPGATASRSPRRRGP